MRKSQTAEALSFYTEDCSTDNLDRWQRHAVQTSLPDGFYLSLWGTRRAACQEGYDICATTDGSDDQWIPQTTREKDQADGVQVYTDFVAKYWNSQARTHLSRIVFTNDIRKKRATMVQNFGFLKAGNVPICDLLIAWHAFYIQIRMCSCRDSPQSNWKPYCTNLAWSLRIITGSSLGDS